ncbi:unnamed protein product [Mytilus coruscus]|uniref:Uncharacterized protein n=1 Tax=Mytilus coruscus TaxID=42192 RepID=A0A6J8A996_MYTCO|nr:unnamed protein product [Mytilus coruscus]
MVAVDEIRSDLDRFKQQNDERFMASNEKLDMLNRYIDNLEEEKKKLLEGKGYLKAEKDVLEVQSTILKTPEEPSTTPNQQQPQQGAFLGDSDIKLSAIWNYLKNYGEPRLVVSVISSNDIRTSMYGLIDHSLIKKALHHVASSAGSKICDIHFINEVYSFKSVSATYKMDIKNT